MIWKCFDITVNANVCFVVNVHFSCLPQMTNSLPLRPVYTRCSRILCMLPVVCMYLCHCYFYAVELFLEEKYDHTQKTISLCVFVTKRCRKYRGANNMQLTRLILYPLLLENQHNLLQYQSTRNICSILIHSQMSLEFQYFWNIQT